jgi:hypothetical protein
LKISLTVDPESCRQSFEDEKGGGFVFPGQEDAPVGNDEDAKMCARLYVGPAVVDNLDCEEDPPPESDYIHVGGRDSEDPPEPEPPPIIIPPVDVNTYKEIKIVYFAYPGGHTNIQTMTKFLNKKVGQGWASNADYMSWVDSMGNSDTIETVIIDLFQAYEEKVIGASATILCHLDYNDDESWEAGAPHGGSLSVYYGLDEDGFPLLVGSCNLDTGGRAYPSSTPVAEIVVLKTGEVIVTKL